MLLRNSLQGALLPVLAMLLVACGGTGAGTPVPLPPEPEVMRCPADNPCVINTIEELEGIGDGAWGSNPGGDEFENQRESLAGHYALGQNIDASVTRRWRGGAGFSPIGDEGTPFSGTLQGGGYEITGLYIHGQERNAAILALFGVINEEAVIEGVHLVDAYVVDAAANEPTGGLVGVNRGGTIRNVSFSGRVEGASPEATGAIVAKNIGGSIFGAASKADVSGGNVVGGVAGYNSGSIVQSFSVGGIAGSEGVGGLVGVHAGEGVITDSYSMGGGGDAFSISGDAYVGGLAGKVADTAAVLRSYSHSRVFGTESVGGLIGKNTGEDADAIVASYWNTTAGGPLSDGGHGLTRINMSVPRSFDGWNFDDTWMISHHDALPDLLNNRR